MKVRKRNGELQEFDSNKIRQAIVKANNDTHPDCRIWEGDIDAIVDEILEELASGLYGGLNHEINKDWVIDIEEIQDTVELILQRNGYYYLAKNYIKYRYKRELIRQGNTTDKTIFELLNGDSEYWNKENSNKDAKVVTVQRDYIAGVTSTDIARRRL